MLPVVLVFVGGGLGAIARYGVSIGVARIVATSFPLPTLLINIIGSFAMGLVVAWFAMRGEGGQDLRLFLTTGVLGGFTTFSAFSLETMLLYERGDVGLALLYVLLSVVVSVLALAAGMALVRVAG
jgi:CrcB protein